MSKQSSNNSTDIPAISSGGQLKNDYDSLFSLFASRAKVEDPDAWLPYVEETLREPTLGGVTFVLTVPERPAGISAIWEGFHTGDSEEDAAKSWEILAKFLVLFLQQADKRWLHPKKISGEPVLVEYHAGTVSKVTGPIVAVRYGEGKNAFESEYDVSQFRDGLSITRGDRIEAAIGLWHQKHQPRGIDELIPPEEQKELDEAWRSQSGVVVGDLEI